MMQVPIFLLLGVAAWTDWRYRMIPNVVIFPFMLAGLTMQIVSGNGLASLGGVVGAFALTFFPVILRGMGMGDQKLLMAFGAWTSFDAVYNLFLWSLLSCLWAVLFLPRSWRRLADNMRLVSVGWISHRTLWFPKKEDSALSLPYAVHLLGGYLINLVVGSS